MTDYQDFEQSPPQQRNSHGLSNYSSNQSPTKIVGINYNDQVNMMDKRKQDLPNGNHELTQLLTDIEQNIIDFPLQIDYETIQQAINSSRDMIFAQFSEMKQQIENRLDTLHNNLEQQFDLLSQHSNLYLQNKNDDYVFDFQAEVKEAFQYILTIDTNFIDIKNEILYIIGISQKIDNTRKFKIHKSTEIKNRVNRLAGEISSDLQRIDQELDLKSSIDTKKFNEIILNLKQNVDDYHKNQDIRKQYLAQLEQNDRIDDQIGSVKDVKDQRKRFQPQIWNNNNDNKNNNVSKQEIFQANTSIVKKDKDEMNLNEKQQQQIQKSQTQQKGIIQKVVDIVNPFFSGSNLNPMNYMSSVKTPEKSQQLIEQNNSYSKQNSTAKSPNYSQQNIAKQNQISQQNIEKSQQSIRSSQQVIEKSTIQSNLQNTQKSFQQIQRSPQQINQPQVVVSQLNKQQNSQKTSNNFNQSNINDFDPILQSQSYDPSMEFDPMASSNNLNRQSVPKHNLSQDFDPMASSHNVRQSVDFDPMGSSISKNNNFQKSNSNIRESTNDSYETKQQFEPAIKHQFQYDPISSDMMQSQPSRKSVQKKNNNWIWNFSISENGMYVVTGCEDGIIRIFNTETRVFIGSLVAHQGPIHSITFSLDNKWIFSGGADCKIRVWSFDSLKCMATLEGHNGNIFGLCCSPDGQYLASASDDRQTRIWDTSILGLQISFTDEDAYATSISFSPNCRIMAQSMANKSIKLYSVPTFRYITSLNNGHTAFVNTVIFSKNGKYMATGGADNLIVVWQSKPYSEEFSIYQKFEGHDQMINSVYFMNNEDFLVSGSSDKTIKVWNLLRKTCEQNLKGHSGIVSAVKVLPNNEIVSTSGDGSVMIWNHETFKCESILTDTKNNQKQFHFTTQNQTNVSVQQQGPTSSYASYKKF